MSALFGLLLWLLAHVWGVNGIIVTFTVEELGVIIDDDGKSWDYLGRAAEVELFSTCRVRIDLSWEEWSDDLLRRVLLHEAGHCLGLRHNTDPTSIMFNAPEVGRSDYLALLAVRPMLPFKAYAPAISR